MRRLRSKHDSPVNVCPTPALHCPPFPRRDFDALMPQGQQLDSGQFFRQRVGPRLPCRLLPCIALVMPRQPRLNHGQVDVLFVHNQSGDGAAITILLVRNRVYIPAKNQSRRKAVAWCPYGILDSGASIPASRILCRM
jgi:hypothetical protein